MDNSTHIVRVGSGNVSQTPSTTRQTSPSAISSNDYTAALLAQTSVSSARNSSYNSVYTATIGSRKYAFSLLKLAAAFVKDCLQANTRENEIKLARKTVEATFGKLTQPSTDPKILQVCSQELTQLPSSASKSITIDIPGITFGQHVDQDNSTQLTFYQSAPGTNLYRQYTVKLEGHPSNIPNSTIQHAIFSDAVQNIQNLEKLEEQENTSKLSMWDSLAQLWNALTVR